MIDIFRKQMCNSPLRERNHSLIRERIKVKFLSSVEELLEKIWPSIYSEHVHLRAGFCSARSAAFRWDTADVEFVSFQVNMTDSIGHGLEKLSCKGLDSKCFKLALWAIN